MSATPSIAVCIPTHNRREDLTHTLARLRQLDPPPDEIVVLADGCSDGTLAFLREEHLQIRLLETPQAVGCVVGRNILMEAATAEIVLGLDDDSYPLETDFVARLRTLFAGNARLAVASFPQRTNEFPETLEMTNFGPPYFAASYVNCACALRRSVFLELGGYTGFFFHMYDEPDYALRCLDAGWEIWHETSLTVRHHFTPVLRNEMRNHHRHARNELWSVLLRCPALQLPGIMLFRAFRQFGYAWRRGLRWCLQEPRWWLQALAGVPKCWAQRRPVSWHTYLAWMRTMRRPIFTRAEWEQTFRPQPRP